MRLHRVCCRGGSRRSSSSGYPWCVLTTRSKALRDLVCPSIRHYAWTHHWVIIRIVLIMILFKIAPNGLIWEKRLAIHHRWLFPIELMEHWVPNVTIKLEHRAASVTNMLTELSIRRGGCFAIFMGWMLLMIVIHAVPLVSISGNVLLYRGTSLVMSIPTTNTLL